MTLITQNCVLIKERALFGIKKPVFLGLRLDSYPKTEFQKRNFLRKTGHSVVRVPLVYTFSMARGVSM